ncbi:hypothetical protein Desaci_1637 [Desulfosporosinus acidiphilus SJ4]|uniref:Uncharacterized protein n=1 Tax=Desulfosporosinus acidiphilus (strain DSM 22704 / JCM 16185 / SJ4) TaxID=646529 RepID=I4D4B2_DESAJ|nr:hypothetical protein [Desulfosporosinus acidiphilus]AFM40636.1 hypothetical protein Desaci_1637 [Desulfosporosinus acidiphilus SJ4]
MKTCRNCGLGIEVDNDQMICFKYKTTSNSEHDKSDCLYFIQKIIEDGEPLSPIQHPLLVEQEIKKGKMNISINDGFRL